jgi:hypothetical protein
MRTQYGKLMLLLQDAVSSSAVEMLGFNPIIPAKSVFSVLEDVGSTGLLTDPLFPVAVREILPENKSR